MAFTTTTVFAQDENPTENHELLASAPSLKQIREAQAAQDRTLGFTQSAAIPLAGAAGDSISTHIALSQPGLYERNALINTSPAGLIGLFAIKAGAVYYFDHQPSGIRKAGLKTTAGIWSGITLNNLLLIAGASNPVGIVGGILFGAYMYNREGRKLEKESTLQTQTLASLPASE